ncbi:MAG TPA: hypothetical protein VMT95_01555 [Candidatus Binatia bacterium]|nr:hypothetical protein [Candidatus Binatia bacterium]
MIKAKPAKLRLRFDKVALAFIDDMRRAGDRVKRGRVMIVTITAPIWQYRKTSAAVHERIHEALAAAPAGLRIDEAIYGNRVCVRVAKNGRAYPSNVIAVVHNPETPATLLIELITAFLERSEAELPAGLERVLK